MKYYLRVCIALLLLAAPAQADQQGVIVRQAPVFTAASSVSGQVGQLPAGTTVTVFGRQGGWQEVYSEKRALTGWVRIYQVRSGNYASQVVTTEQEDSRGFLAGLASFSRQASGFFTQESGATSSGTATIGVRGLSESEIKSAQADFDELKKMKKLASKPERMDRFSAEGGLQASKVPYISGLKP